MSIFVYKVEKGKKGCNYCKKGFELLQRAGENPVKSCPKCKSPVKKVISGFSLGSSKTTLDRKAKDKGFHKLKKVDKGKYEKLY